ncbi:Lrp/AsnC family transcriptional regulator [Candidatus Woesearchaeota archaeon]|nr:Lrp/AsnC family transcriptional regulator [Candidatus Woesearchaeota archaeon]
MTKLDSKDKKILEIFGKNCRLPFQKIAKQTGIPITTIHNRVKRLEAEKIITGYKASVDQRKLGKMVSAFIAVTVDYKLLKAKKMTQNELAEQLLAHPAVEFSAMVTGTSDIIIKARVADTDALSQFVTVYLRNLDGVEKTQTSVVLNEAQPKSL